MFIAMYTIKNFANKTITEGVAKYDNENEMYADLEVQEIVEENPNVTSLMFCETIDFEGKTYTINSWM